LACQLFAFQSGWLSRWEKALSRQHFIALAFQANAPPASSKLFVLLSGQVVIYNVMGGVGTLVGPIMGARPPCC
jgi:hypothetical protein